MKRSNTKALVGMVLLNLIGLCEVKAADTNASIVTSTGTVTSSGKHHPKHKNTADGSNSSKSTGIPVGSNIFTGGNTTGNTDAPGMSNSLGNNNPGSPNMGSPDHVPGTSGTSGQ